MNTGQAARSPCFFWWPCGRMRLLESGMEGAKVPSSHPFLPHSLGKRHQILGHSCKRIQSQVLKVALVSLATSIRGNVLFVRPDFLPGRRLSSPKSLQTELPGNIKYPFTIVVHFIFIVWQETKTQKHNRNNWSASAPSSEGGQTYIYCCRH